MTANTITMRSLRPAWIATWAVPVALQLFLSLGLPSSFVLDAPTLLFWVVVIAASLCVITAIAMIGRSMRTNEAELGGIGTFFFAVSALPLVHGITTPGVVYGENTSTMTSVLWALPIGLVAAAPILLPRRARSVRLQHRWKTWVIAANVAITACGVLLLISPSLLPAPTPRSPFTLTVATLSCLGAIMLSHRHLRLAVLAQRRGPLVMSLGLGLVGSSAFVWADATPYSAGFWAAHVLDISGVFTGTIGGMIVYRRTRDVQSVLGPVLVTDPLAALEIGIDPIVHQFVADLDRKDHITRDHVVRTAELAVRIGQEIGLQPDDLRRVGLAAILHDVGKLAIPDEILTKPGKLTDEEFGVIRTHAVLGAQMVATSPVLAEIAPIVRGHHERVDGGGYPDGLVGDAVPLEARIVAVCDAFDAMVNTRQYRIGMGQEKAISILREHAGAQWDPAIVEALIAVVAVDPPTALPSTALAAVGHNVSTRIGCDCVPETLTTLPSPSLS